MKNELHVIGIQGDLVWEKPDQNLAFFEKKINELPSTTDLVILPEMFSSGFTMQPENVAETMQGKTLQWMKNLASKNDLAITGSLVVKENNQFFNRLIFVHPSKKIETYDKRHSFTLAGEDRVYSSGNKKIIVDYKGWKICPLICYDLRFPVWTRNTENYDILIFMANWPVKRINAWKTLLKARAIENMSYTIGINRTGKDGNDYDYSGDSIIVDYLGEELSSLTKNEIGIVQATLVKTEQQTVRNKLQFLNDKDTFTVNP